jgi:hypothetical protein
MIETKWASRNATPALATPVRLALAAASLLLAVVTGCGKPTAPSSPQPQTSRAKPEWFADITARSGIQFTQVVRQDYFMPDQMASGLALFDYDNDGRLDVYFVQAAGTNFQVRNQLFHQEADGTFRDVSAGSGVDVIGLGQGVCAGDANNDGLADLVVTEYGAVRLFQNLGGGKFREVSRKSGLDNPRWATAASFLDFDRDGRLDLVTGNYVDYDPTQVCHDLHGNQDFCAPRVYGETVSRLWHNITPTPGGVPRFEDYTEQSGFSRAPGIALGFVCGDFDGDAWPDIFITDDGRPNRLFINQRNGRFTEEAVQRGLAFNAMGGTAANMGTAFGDVDNDGLPDLFVTHLTEEFHSLWKQGPRGVFTDQMAHCGLQQQAWRGTAFGTALADFDCDGDVDLAFVNGLVRRFVPGQTPVQAGIHPWWACYAQRAQLFENTGNGTFREISTNNPSFSGEAMIGRSFGVGDLDNDGALDLVVCGTAGSAKVFKNTVPHRGHWLRLRLLDAEHGNRDAIGAEGTVVAGAKRWWRLLQPSASYLTSIDPTLHFGLGSATNFDRIEVQWTDGTKQAFPGGKADRLLTLRKQPATK